MTTPVSDEAITAAAGAIYDLLGRPGTLPTDRAQAANRIALAAVEAAALLIRADERHHADDLACLRGVEDGTRAERSRILALLDGWTCPCGEKDCSAYDTRDLLTELIEESGHGN